MTRSYYRGAEGCLLVFDVTDRRSFIDLKGWLEDLQKWAEEDVVIMLVGNKSERKIKTFDSSTFGFLIAE